LLRKHGAQIEDYAIFFDASDNGDAVGRASKALF
jgi:hypothetical protein